MAHFPARRNILAPKNHDINAMTEHKNVKIVKHFYLKILLKPFKIRKFRTTITGINF